MRRRRGARSAGVARRDGESGAAAVEFALVLPVLLLILFGIVDYGIYFSDSLAGQSGVQNATRQASIASFQPCAKAPTDFVSNQADGAAPTVDMQDIACMVASRTQALTGTVYVDVVLPTTNGVTDWAMGQPLLVCETIVASGLTGWVPLPGHGTVRSKAVMTIQDDSKITPEAGGVSSPASADEHYWDWCSL